MHCRTRHNVNSVIYRTGVKLPVWVHIYFTVILEPALIYMYSVICTTASCGLEFCLIFHSVLNLFHKIFLCWCRDHFIAPVWNWWIVCWGFALQTTWNWTTLIITINCASFVSNIVPNKLNTFNFSIINWFSFMTFYLVRKNGPYLWINIELCLISISTVLSLLIHLRLLIFSPNEFKLIEYKNWNILYQMKFFGLLWNIFWPMCANASVINEITQN